MPPSHYASVSIGTPYFMRLDARCYRDVDVHGRRPSAMSGRTSSSSGQPHELLCSRCFKRESCVQCCGTRFCLRHFHTSNHASEHPRKAFVMNQGALDEQLPAFQEMWREAFLSVADDVDRLTRDVGDKVALDPLASIGMEKPAAPKGKMSDKSLGASSAAAKRRRKENKEKEMAEASVDPFARRKTRPKSYWTVGIGPGGSAEDDASVAAEKAAAAAAAAAPHVGEYQCESCSSDNTSFDIIGGAAVGTRKAETFGRKDAPELILRVVCHACGNNWLEER